MTAAVRRLLRQRSVVRFALLLALLGLCGLAMLLAPHPDPTHLRDSVHHLGAAGPVVAVLAGALLLVVLVPRTFITLAWGAVFGTVPGALYTLLAALLAAAVGFGIGRALGREFVAERLRGRLSRLDGWFARQNVYGVITVRMLPVGGFGLVSYGYGTTGARMMPFLVGSVLASIPSAFGYAALGAAATSPGPVNWFAVAPAALGMIATGVIIQRWWRTERRARQLARSAGVRNEKG